ncbi:HAD family hydrolase [Marinitoga litoralis]|uniref:HAD family hydrolase n=1 Tax=Marinitoga litoralis TaxID=570855 RepID=UPI001961842C|nr:HAD family hydrolase [Marinitoga litoralis]MBM7559837.1 Cof subfamily protein (haloacid dehalogenase superfamily) [Marinitoga litoralis]
MNRKVFIFDLDGTLLNSKEQMSERTINAIKKIYEKGSFIIIASGRMYKSTKVVINKYLPFLNEIPIVSYNGAYVVSHSGEVVFESDIDKKLAIDIIKEAKKEKIHVQTYINDDLIADDDNNEIKGYAKHSGVDYKIVNDLEDYILKNKYGPTKILTISDEKRLDFFQKNMQAKYNNELNIVRSFNIYLDFLNKDSSKGIALKKLSNIYNFDLKNAYIFGDSENDISMLVLSNNSYAMDNASNHVKNSAKFIAPSSDEEGVALIIEKILSSDFGN